MTAAGKLKATSWLLLGLGLALNIRGQIEGTRARAPDPTERMIWAVVPFALLAIVLWRLTTTKGQSIFVVVFASILALTSTMYTNDEMRLTYALTPVMQLLTVLFIVAVLVADRWRLRRQERRASPAA